MYFHSVWNTWIWYWSVKHLSVWFNKHTMGFLICSIILKVNLTKMWERWKKLISTVADHYTGQTCIDPYCLLKITNHTPSPQTHTRGHNAGHKGRYTRTSFPVKRPLFFVFLACSRHTGNWWKVPPLQSPYGDPLAPISEVHTESSLLFLAAISYLSKPEVSLF